jgi:hypothetical protein
MATDGPVHYYHPSLEPLKFKIYQGTELIALPQPEGSLHARVARLLPLPSCLAMNAYLRSKR